MDEPTQIGQTPQFDPEGSMFQDQGAEEVKDIATDEVATETDTPAELPADSAQAEEQPASPDGDGEDTEQPPVDIQSEIERATVGLRQEIVTLRQKLATATGNDRKIAQEQLVTAQGSLDELKDVAPTDVELVEKVLKAKGYVSKDELAKITYQSAQDQALKSFLEKYPEYKPENDPENVNWSRLTSEYGIYAQPKDPSMIATLLERSHKAISGTVVSDRTLPAKKRAAQVASAGAGGTQRSSSGGKTLTPDQRRVYQDGGWSDEEIKQIEENLS